MRSALYYPHTSIANVNLIKSALLLWDRLEYIAPWEGFKESYADPLIERAMGLIGVARYPTDSEKSEVHTHIEDLATRALPTQFYFGPQDGATADPYEIYPQKLLPKTWELLQGLQLSGKVLANADYPTTEATGLTIMSILADCCAGTTRSRVTDRGAAYATLAEILRADAEPMAPKPEQFEEQLVSMALDVIDARSVDLVKLVEFRERENGRNGASYSELRHRYLDSLEKYVKALTTTKGRAADAEEIKRAYRDDMKIDLENLKAELGSAKREALFSKDILVTTAAAVGTVATAAFGVPIPILGAISAVGVPATVGGVLGAGNKYFAARRAIMQKHPMAYVLGLS